MGRTPTILVKTAAVAGFAWATFCWLSFFVPWATPRPYVDSYVGLYVTSVLVVFVAASCAVISLNRKNIWRVSTNAIIIFGCFAVGWFFGDPLSRGSYDHGNGESAQGWLLIGTLGTLVGYGLTLLREVYATNKARSQA